MTNYGPKCYTLCHLLSLGDYRTKLKGNYVKIIIIEYLCYYDVNISGVFCNQQLTSLIRNGNLAAYGRPKVVYNSCLRATLDIEEDLV